MFVKWMKGSKRRPQRKKENQERVESRNPKE